MQAAADGLGVVLGIPVMASEEIAEGTLVAPFSLSLPTGASYYLVHTAAAERDPPILAFRDWLLSEAHSEPWAQLDAEDGGCRRAQPRPGCRARNLRPDYLLE